MRSRYAARVMFALLAIAFVLFGASITLGNSWLGVGSQVAALSSSVAGLVCVILRNRATKAGDTDR